MASVVNNAEPRLNFDNFLLVSPRLLNLGYNERRNDLVLGSKEALIEFLRLN